MSKAMTAKKQSFAERLAAMPPALNGKDWFERLPKDVQDELNAVRELYRSGSLRHTLREIWRECRREFSLTIGDDAFTTWLRK